MASSKTTDCESEYHIRVTNVKEETSVLGK
jgi:hypothetical protein